MGSRAKKKNRPLTDEPSPPIGAPSLTVETTKRAWFSFEDRINFVVMGVVLLLTNYPYFVGMQLVPDGKVFSGLFFNDMLSYIAKMRDGYDGYWHYTNRYTTEPTGPSLLFMFYVFLGHVARWMGLSMVATYHLFRVLGAVMLMFALRRLIRSVGLSGWGAVAAFVLCFSIASLPFPIPSFVTVERYFISEGHCLLTIVYFPHITISTAFLVLIMTEFQLLSRNQAFVGAIIRAGIWSFCMTWIHPRLLLTAGLVGWVMAALIVMLEKRFPWRLAAGGIAFAVSGGLTAGAILNSYRGDPILEYWATIATLSPHIIVIIFAYGAMFPMALLGMRVAWQERYPGSLLLLLWIVIGFGLCYYPSGHQRRMFQGFDIPVALASGYALDHMLRAATRRFGLTPKLQALALFLALGLCNLKLLPTIHEIYSPAAKGVYPWYMSESQLSGFEWLRDHSSPEDIVLCTDLTGQAIPGYAGNRVFVGHWAETFRRIEKKDEFFKFRNAKTSPEWRRSFLEQNKIRYLFWSPLEFAPSDKPDDLVIYDPISDIDLWNVGFIHPSAEDAEVVILERIENP